MSLHYHDYLKIGPLLDLQNRISETSGNPSHDEWLFIITHQVYELWFKQLLIELESILQIFGGPRVDDLHMRTIVQRLERIREIQRLLIQQVNVMESMSALDFLEFRSQLSSASGFQSHQFRKLETLLGLKKDSRLPYNNTTFDKSLKPDQQTEINSLSQTKSLFEAVEHWLERTPFLQAENFDFWGEYRRAIQDHLSKEKISLQERKDLTPEQRARFQTQFEMTEKTWKSLFDVQLFEQLRAEGHWRLRHKAVISALFIQVYRDQPILNLPYRLIELLLDLDENMTQWRYRHALMARRMLGAKVGTGGSSGYSYLIETVEKHKVFDDFFKITTFLVERSRLPALPEKVKTKLGFAFS